jgi:endonuclease/exonuclease/phosphatase family metal-dependent hydrolase
MIQEFLVGGDENEVVIILGDFNTEPQSDSIKKMQTHYTSAYNLEDNALVTTWKTRGSDTVRRVIDYIFYSNLKCTATLSIPLAEMEELKLPSLRYPSDHILIGAKFELPESHSDKSKD